MGLFSFYRKYRFFVLLWLSAGTGITYNKDIIYAVSERGGVMVTIKEIAKYCNVSIATISNIINGKPNASQETKQRVLKAIEELNYTPNYIAKNLKTRRTKTIGVVVEDHRKDHRDTYINKIQ